MSNAHTEEKPPRAKTLFRYANLEHQKLVRKCAEAAGMSINDWIRQVTLKAARREAAEVARLDAAREATNQI